MCFIIALFRTWKGGKLHIGTGEAQEVVRIWKVNTVAMTEHELALMNVMEVVSPSSINLLCVFHISKIIVWSVISMSNIIGKSMLWTYGAKSCIQI